MCKGIPQSYTIFLFLKTLTTEEWMLKSPLLNMCMCEETFASRGKL